MRLANMALEELTEAMNRGWGTRNSTRRPAAAGRALRHRAARRRSRAGAGDPRRRQAEISRVTKNPDARAAPRFERFTRATDLIYNAAVTPDLWPDLLHELAQSVSCHFGGMVINSVDRGLVDGTAVGVSRDAHQAYLRRFFRNSPFGRSSKSIVGVVEENSRNRVAPRGRADPDV